MNTTSRPGFYFQETNEFDEVTYYGPFPTERAATEAVYFYRPVSYRDSACNARSSLHILILGVGRYTKGELSGVLEEPEAYRYSKARLLATDKLTRHKSWDTMGFEFTLELRAKDMEFIYGVAA